MRKYLTEHFNVTSIVISAFGALMGMLIVGLSVVLWTLAAETHNDVKALVSAVAAIESRMTNAENDVRDLQINTVSRGRFDTTMKSLRLKVGDFDGFDGTEPTPKIPVDGFPAKR